MKTYEERTAAVVEMVAQKHKRRRAIIAGVSTSVTCVVVLVLSLVLFLPYQAPNAGAYQKVADAVFSMEYRNNWEAWGAEIGDGLRDLKYVGKDYAVDDEVSFDSATREGSNSAPSKATDGMQGADGYTEQYVENTNLQVAEVKEGDVLKESTHYFYRLRRECGAYVDGEILTDAPLGYSQYRTRLRLDIYRKAGLDTECVATYVYDVSDDEGMVDRFEMYLSEDCTAVTIIFGDTWISKTRLLLVDVSHPDDVRLVGAKTVSGNYISSRVAGERLLLYTYYRTVDYTLNDPKTYIPYVEENGQRAYTAADDIVCPESSYNMQFDVLTMFDASLTSIGQVAMLGYNSSAVLYVNESRAYLAAAESLWRAREESGSYTCITCVEWAPQFRVAANLEICGVVNDQYWMDEYAGVFRVAASTFTYTDQRQIKFASWSWERNASLYCFSVDTWQSVGKVENFAPRGESVQSARFVGTKAYICTAEIITFTDPVYCFDLSDYAHITHTDTGAIDGYSTSLIPFTDGTLLGIGMLSNGTVKLELYRETETEVQSVSALTFGGTERDEQGEVISDKFYDAFNEYKSYLLRAADGVVGLPCVISFYTYEASTDSWTFHQDCCYLLCVYRDGALRLARSVLFEDGVDSYTRAAVSDGYVYIFGTTELKVLALAELE